MSPAIHVTTAAWDTIRREVAAGPSHLETGGILLGHDFGDLLQVTVAGDPGRNSQRSRDRFLRDSDHAAQLAARAWEADRAQWLGEWHTHPATPPAPSSIDLASYARHLQDPDLSFDRFLSVIIGLDDQRQALVAAWIITRDVVTPVPIGLGDPQ
ncbi:hypothetical protein GCM10010413_07220 [Promicromonospora sukumoe]|uniref:Integrative and conjugative element protein (TIGR02256 family) n=1 Tax=Promicromonospora sukumoe TaxID=88382 RepID=A0A7W3J574_9MICO|nr:Mov34/MPN/PAD-1 family protein [Promicromonospora sukumoe]MBA8806394.1 integrative and conjugative element protein (TIGR02256 family) [Promicromonospora sukumoe]